MNSLVRATIGCCGRPLTLDRGVKLNSSVRYLLLSRFAGFITFVTNLWAMKRGKIQGCSRLRFFTTREEAIRRKPGRITILKKQNSHLLTSLASSTALFIVAAAESKPSLSCSIPSLTAGSNIPEPCTLETAEAPSGDMLF